MTDTTESPRPTHRFWIPLLVLALAAIAIFFVNSNDNLDRNFRAWISVITLILVCALNLIWFVFLSGYRWTTRLVGVVLLFAAGFGLRKAVRFEAAMDGRGLLEPAWIWSPTKDEILAKRLAANPVQQLSGAPTTASSDDFPEFLGPGRKNFVSNVRLDGNWLEHPPQLLWRKPLGLGWGSFAVASGRALTQEQRGDDELVVCYDLRSGAPLWAHTNQARFSESFGGVGPRATPTIVDRQVFAIGGTGILDCLDLNSGTLRWSRSVLKESNQPNLQWGKSSSPLVFDDLVVVTGGQSAGPTVLAYKRSSGEPVWSVGTDNASYASPILATLNNQRQIVSLNATDIMGIEPASGKVLWSYTWAPKSKFPRCAQPVVVGENRIFFSAGYGLGSGVISVKPSNGGTWEVREEWVAKTMKTQFNNVSVKDGYVYGIDDGFLACVDVASGARKWKDGRFGSGQSLLVDSYLLVQNETGRVALVDAKPESFNQIATLDALSSKTWNNPVVAAPYLLVRNDQEAACYELPRLSEARQSAKLGGPER